MHSGALWNVIRAAKWAGGNGVGARIVAMNFSAEESLQLYRGCHALGAKPFAAFSYAAVKAAREVLGEGPTSIVQQVRTQPPSHAHTCPRMLSCALVGVWMRLRWRGVSEEVGECEWVARAPCAKLAKRVHPARLCVRQASLQTRHYATADQGDSRDLVGDWLIGPVQHVPNGYSLSVASEAARQLGKDLSEVGPMTLRAITAKAYGLFNTGAAGFEIMPTYNDDAHCLTRCLFMNNYGVRTMPPGSGLRAWNWNAPLWLGVNTINVDGYTTTLVGSSMWGLDVVTALRDHMEATLREIMSHHEDKAGLPTEIAVHRGPPQKV